MSIDPSATIWSRPEAERADAPLVVVMHGRGSNEGDLAGLFPLLPSGFVYAAVRAPFAFGPGFAWWAAAPDDIPGDPPAAALDASAALLLDVLDALPMPTDRVGLLGFSQGGAMSTHVLRREPDRVAFAVNLAGFVVSGEQPGDARLAELRPPVFFGRGEADPVIPAAASARTEAFLPTHSTLEHHVYAGLGHGISQEELDDAVGFLTARI